MCLLKPRHGPSPPRPRPPRRPAPPSSRHRPSHSHGASSGGTAPSSSSFSTAMPFSSSTAATADYSSTSTSSIASLKELIPDGPSLFSFREICSCTGNFSPAQKIGRSVWKATLRHTPVAISRKQAGAPPPRGHSSGVSTVIRHMYYLHHANIVPFLGACREGEHFYLVYEFMEGANLRDCLRSKIVGGYSPLSSWLSRLQIAVDVAKGLEYLHHLSSPPLVHKYIDSRNILISNDMRARIAHTGIAQVTGEVARDQQSGTEVGDSVIQEEAEAGVLQDDHYSRRLSRTPSMKIHGIHGYMPPEYVNLGHITTRYDVFSFGVVLAELLSGKEAVPSQPKKGVTMPLNLSDDLRVIMSEPDCIGKLRLWMDPLLKDSYPLDDVLKVASIANACMDPDPGKRPLMSDMASRLQRHLISSQKWQATVGVQREILSATLQPR